MSWLFPLTKSASSSAAGSPGGLTSLQQQKQRLIESLRNSHSSIAEIQKDVEYRLPFTVNNLTININILLPPQFPQEKPVISVYPPIRHHLMDKQGVYVTSPLVNNFTMHSDLGKIIQSLLDEFWKNPPVLAPSSTAFSYLYSNPSGMPPYASQGFPFLPPYPPQEANRTITSLSVADTISSSTTSYTTAKPAAPSFGILSNLPLPVPTTDTSAPISQNGFGYKMPDVPDAFPELSELSLRSCFSWNTASLRHFMKNCFVATQIWETLHPLYRIEDLALDFLFQSCSASALQARLKVAAHEAEEESDNIAEDFLEGKTEIDDFLSSFMEKRTICHCRRAKEEKLQQAITTHSQFHAPL
uniref:vacuolar protein sorting-associated protein 37A n=1 Tax=Panthera onca TaxID=9690 RepID=UPI0029545434|nr:vacuolar protein sorting-associated protein 37A [Panthera onca]